MPAGIRSRSAEYGGEGRWIRFAYTGTVFPGAEHSGLLSQRAGNDGLLLNSVNNRRRTRKN